MIKFVLGLPFSYRQKKLAATRPAIDKEQFVFMLSPEGTDRQAAEKIWDALVAERVDESFAPYPDDSLGRILGIADEERDQDLIARLLKELGIPVPDRDFTTRFGAVDSARRVVGFIAECRRRAARS